MIFSIHTGHLNIRSVGGPSIDMSRFGRLGGDGECCRLRRFEELDSGEHKSTTAVIRCTLRTYGSSSMRIQSSSTELAAAAAAAVVAVAVACGIGTGIGASS